LRHDKRYGVVSAPTHDSAVFIERRNLVSTPSPDSISQASLDRYEATFLVSPDHCKEEFTMLQASGPRTFHDPASQSFG